MATFNVQISNMAGALTSEDVDTHIEHAIKDVVNKLARINPDMMHMFSGNENNADGNGFVQITDNNMIFKVARREGSVYRTCIEAPSSLEADLVDANSLNKATTEYPRYIRSNSKITVFPTVTTANFISVTKVVYGTPSTVGGNGEISNFPSGMYPMVVCHAAMNTILEKMAETLPAGALQDVDQLQIDGNAFSDNASPTDAELDNPSHYFARLREFINEEEDTELSAVQLEKITAYLNWYATSIEKNKTDYNWLMERLMILKDRYEKMFLPYVRQQGQEDARSES
tara:strand:- start:1387 stop:2244 length:858 start_codon:yes stop_codon:yes gene_type:complete